MDLKLKPRILFVCSILGARAHVASFYIEKFCPDKITASSSGFEQNTFNKEIRDFLETKGVSLPIESPQNVFARHSSNECYDYVITLCNDAAREQCPIFRKSVYALFSQPKMLHWDIADFQSVSGSDEFVKNHWNNIVDDIKNHTKDFIVKELKLPITDI